MADPIIQSWEYLETLPGIEFYRLYQHPSSALAIFRKRLSDLAKCFVMALLYMKNPLPISDLELWVKPGNTRERERALDLLHRYHIFSTTSSEGVRAYSLTEEFAKSLRQALTGAGPKESFGSVTKTPLNEDISINDLDNFARNQWEGILGYMVGNSAIPLESTAIQPSNAVKELLRAGHLVEFNSNRGTPSITKEGFAFVLQDINTQVWALLFLYVDNAEVLGMTRVEVLSFLFFVSSLELGLAYTKSTLTENQHKMLSDLSDFGIVYQHPPSSKATYFYPTRLAVTLTSDSTSALATVSSALSSSLSTPHPNHNPTTTSSSNNPSKGFIIIETNYRVYAYTSSPLQISLLALFINLRSRHPNLVTGKMSKNSIQRAVQNGITADQIISYLSSHAHPQMRRVAAANAAAAAAASTSATSSSNENRPYSVLPGTIIDQINLWQLERDRMHATTGYLFKDFATQTEFDEISRYAGEIGVLAWKDDKKKLFFATRYEPMQAYLVSKKRKAEAASESGSR